MIEDELTHISALKEAGDHPAARRHAVALAQAHRDDVRAQLAAAYACDRLGLEHEAIDYYEHASALGVPSTERPGFLVGFGSTLRNLGRIEEAVACLAQATQEYPDNAALHAFLSLAQHSAGRFDLALASMLKAALQAARPDGFGSYARALGGYQAELAAATDRSATPARNAGSPLSTR